MAQKTLTPANYKSIRYYFAELEYYFAELEYTKTTSTCKAEIILFAH